MGASPSRLRKIINDPIIVGEVTAKIEADEDWAALFAAQHLAGRLDCLNDIVARESFLFNKGHKRWTTKNRALTAAVKDYVLRHLMWCECMLAENKSRITARTQPPALPFFFSSLLEAQARLTGTEGSFRPIRPRPNTW